MHPATSIIVFTVSSGAGFGLLACLGVPALWGNAPSGGYFWAGFVLAFALSVGGLLSSTFHLGHPERAWRALSQWRSSWLSREGVMAVITLITAGLYALICLSGVGGAALFGGLTAALALVTVYTTSMIYGQLKTVDRWHSPMTPLCFLAFSLASGASLAALLRALLADGGAGGWPVVAALFIFLGWSVRQRAWTKGDEAPPTSTTETATGLGHMGRVRLFESPHTGPNYLMKEMGFSVARRHAGKLRKIAVLLGGFVPLVMTLLATMGLVPAFCLFLAAIALLCGLLVERWLFFAEARHAVMTYYDRDAT